MYLKDVYTMVPITMIERIRASPVPVFDVVDNTLTTADTCTRTPCQRDHR